MVATTTIAMPISSLKVKGSMVRTSAQQKYSWMLNGAKETRQRKEEKRDKIYWINTTTKKANWRVLSISGNTSTEGRKVRQDLLDQHDNEEDKTGVERVLSISGNTSTDGRKRDKIYGINTTTKKTKLALRESCQSR